MVDLLSDGIAALGVWDWSEIVKSCATIWTAVIATLALQNWKHQSKAKRQSDFLDELTNALHDLLALIADPIASVNLTKMALIAYSSEKGFPLVELNEGVTRFIEECGERHSEIITGKLALCEPALVKVRSLAAKGQALDIKNYSECFQACEIIASQFGRAQAFGAIIGSTSLYWKNPEVQKTVLAVLNIDSQAMNAELKMQSSIFLAFLRESYRSVYR